MSSYYNDNDPKVCEKVRRLIRAGLVPPGEVDCRSIADVRASDLRGFTQQHFFCGILGWPLALQLAGWPESRPIATMSVPCQPYSVAGKGLAQADERHLWPEAFRLIRECRYECAIGEQVKNAIGHGWLDGISADLEGEGYAIGAHVLGAHSIGSPHRRQRIFWVAHPERNGRATRSAPEPGHQGGRAQPDDGGSESRLGESNGAGSQQRHETAEGARHWSSIKPAGFWDDSEWHYCRDGKYRRIPRQPERLLQCVVDELPEEMDRRAEDGFPLSGKIDGRAGILKVLGNAIIPVLAAEFVKAYLEIIDSK